MWDKVNVFGRLDELVNDIVMIGILFNEFLLIDMISNDFVFCGVKVSILYLFILLEISFDVFIWY